MIRRACVAGQFYPGEPSSLRQAVADLLKTGKGGREKAVAIVAPHAGYIYSGRVAGRVYSEVVVPDSIVLIGPNHTGLGANAAVMVNGIWETPIGNIEVDRDLAMAVAGATPSFSEDSVAHLGEHSLEVQLPFIHTINPSARIVPITVMSAGPRECEEMGRAIAGAIRSHPGEVLIVVSSDMNHYEPDDVTREKDRHAIDMVLELDWMGLLKVTAERHITMCGVVPAAIAIVAARHLGAGEARLSAYATSGEGSGDYTHVVGYAGIVIK